MNYKFSLVVRANGKVMEPKNRLSDDTFSTYEEANLAGVAAMKTLEGWFSSSPYFSNVALSHVVVISENATSA